MPPWWTYSFWRRLVGWTFEQIQASVSERFGPPSFPDIPVIPTVLGRSESAAAAQTALGPGELIPIELVPPVPGTSGQLFVYRIQLLTDDPERPAGSMPTHEIASDYPLDNAELAARVERWIEREISAQDQYAPGFTGRWEITSFFLM